MRFDGHPDATEVAWQIVDGTSKLMTVLARPAEGERGGRPVIVFKARMPRVAGAATAATAAVSVPLAAA